MIRQTFVRVLAILALLAAVPAWAGVHYKAETVMSGAQKSRTAVEAWVDGEKTKVVFVESDQPMMGPSTYLLSTDGGKTLYLVNPQEKTYMEWDLQGMLAAFGSVMESMQGLMSMEFSDVEVKKLSEESGGELLGYSTVHSRYRTSYTTLIKVMGIKRQSTTETIQEIWSTDAFGDPGFGVWLRSEPPATGIEGLDEMIASEMSRVEGLPLKTVVTSTTVGQKGKRETTTTTETEVTMIEKTSISDSEFEIPAGYTKQEMQMEGAGEEEEDANPFGRFLKGRGKGGR